MRDNTPFPDEYVPNQMTVVNNLMQTQTPRIQSRAIGSNGKMYFFTITQFPGGQNNMTLYSIALANNDGATIAFAELIDSYVQFNPSDDIEVAYTINVLPAEISTSLSSAYFKEMSAVMVGKNVGGLGVYRADNGRYVVPNRAKLLSSAQSLIDSKVFTPKGTGSFIGTSEGDLEWEKVMEATPYYVQWWSHYSARPEMLIGTTYLDQDLQDAYPEGDTIETRFSIELKN